MNILLYFGKDYFEPIHEKIMEKGSQLAEKMKVKDPRTMKRRED